MMVDLDTAMRITAAVRARVVWGEMFSAYDITRAVREQGVFLRHDDGRAVVHDLFEQNLMGADYCRTLVDFGGERGPAFLYHPFNVSPMAYGQAAADSLE